jgi:two-component system phosphate regulon response regulator PhoB
MNLDTHEVSLDNAPLHLTRSEFRILNELITNCEKVLTRDQLVEKTQGEGVNVTNRTIDTHVFGLRKKLGDKSDWIETIRGVGYRLMAE